MFTNIVKKLTLNVNIDKMKIKFITLSLIKVEVDAKKYFWKKVNPHVVIQNDKIN